MFYMGIHGGKEGFSLALADMNRKTASRLYEVKYLNEGLSLSDALTMVKQFLESNEFKTIKKKFSQAGRPPRREVVLPYLILCSEDEDMKKSLLDMRVSHSEVVFDGREEDPQVFNTTKDEAVSMLKKVFNENRMGFDASPGVDSCMISKVRSFDDFKESFKALAVLTVFTESVKKVKRY